MLTQGFPKSIPHSVRLKNSPPARHDIVFQLSISQRCSLPTQIQKKEEYFTFLSDYAALPGGC